MSPAIQKWAVAIAINVVLAAYLGYALVAPASPVKAAFLPGRTTHGHHQIELACSECHAAVTPASMTADDVLQDACTRCHAESLSNYDTHPAKKFNDPVNAELLTILDAQRCVTCHREHVPEQTHGARLTHGSGITVPADYCWHCHQDVADHRTSHVGMAFDSCATAGCHHYHDNRAIYEKYLNDHHGQPDHLSEQVLPARNLGRRWQKSHPESRPLGFEQADAPEFAMTDDALVSDWADTAHAAAGVNCGSCHGGEPNGSAWSNAVAMEVCQSCHDDQTATFTAGKHGMRLAAGLSPMTPSMARLPMHAGAAHAELDCNACHTGHRFDTGIAAANACLNCHADSHSLAYADSGHAALWSAQISGDAAAGTGVSCATCHMPRLTDGKSVWVNHNQSEVLHPPETMARQVCGHCHGLQYALSSLSDPDLALNCYATPPREIHRSVAMAHEYFEAKRKKRERRKRSSL